MSLRFFCLLKMHLTSWFGTVLLSVAFVVSFYGGRNIQCQGFVGVKFGASLFPVAAPCSSSFAGAWALHVSPVGLSALLGARRS